MNKLVLLGWCFQDLEKLKKMAEEKGLKVKILANREDVFPEIKKNNADKIVGVCCEKKSPAIEKKLNKIGITYQAVRVDTCGRCVKETGIKARVDLEKYKEALEWLKNL